MTVQPESGTAGSGWLGAPWAGAALRFIADPADGLDPAAVADWPAWAPLDAIASRPAIRGRLGRWLVGDHDDPAALIDGFAEPRALLALIPTADAEHLIRLLTAWLDAPDLARLIRRADVEAARATIGDAAFEFAKRRAAVLRRPGPTLVQAVDQAAPAGTSFVPDAALTRGAAAFGLAMGAVPTGAIIRLRLRRPAALWATVADHCRNDEAGVEAWACIRLLLRDWDAAWSTWFN